jgi:hypothetical protein
MNRIYKPSQPGDHMIAVNPQLMFPGAPPKMDGKVAGYDQTDLPFRQSLILADDRVSDSAILGGQVVFAPGKNKTVLELDFLQDKWSEEDRHIFFPTTKTTKLNHPTIKPVLSAKRKRKGVPSALPIASRSLAVWHRRLRCAPSEEDSLQGARQIDREAIGPYYSERAAPHPSGGYIGLHLASLAIDGTHVEQDFILCLPKNRRKVDHDIRTQLFNPNDQHPVGSGGLGFGYRLGIRRQEGVPPYDALGNAQRFPARV